MQSFIIIIIYVFIILKSAGRSEISVGTQNVEGSGANDLNQTYSFLQSHFTTLSVSDGKQPWQKVENAGGEHPLFGAGGLQDKGCLLLCAFPAGPHHMGQCEVH